MELPTMGRTTDQGSDQTGNEFLKVVQGMWSAEDHEKGVDRAYLREEILQDEKMYLSKRAGAINEDEIHTEGLSVAVSGGGLRAASQGLGLQLLLKDLGLLSEVEYWSSVSGGGYTSCGWLSHIASQNPKFGGSQCTPQDKEELEDVLARGERKRGWSQQILPNSALYWRC